MKQKEAELILFRTVEGESDWELSGDEVEEEVQTLEQEGNILEE